MKSSGMSAMAQPGAGGALQRKAPVRDSLTGREGMALFELMKCWRARKPWRVEESQNPQKLWRFARLHWLGAMVEIVGLDMDEDPCGLARQARDLYFSGLIRHERALRTCSDIELAARSTGVQVVALKGPALVDQAYGGQAARQYGDIDLFIPEKSEAWKLLETIGAAGTARVMDGAGFYSRMRNPGKIQADYEGFLLEITCLEGEPSDPMLELFHRHRDRLFGSGKEEGILSPDPSAHFVYLLLHMLTHHLCARLVWFMDLVAMNDKNLLDIEWITRELEAMELSGTAGHMAAFVQAWIDPAFPGLGAAQRGRRRFLAVMTDREVVFNRGLGPQYVTGMKRTMLHVVYLVLYFLIGDGKSGGKASRSNAARWMGSRYARGLGYESRRLRKAIAWLAASLILPLSRIVDLALFSGKWFAMRP